jgi:hypothetical protein
VNPPAENALEEFVSRLGATGVSYMLVGATAAQVWGLRRTSVDFDFVVDLALRDVDRFAGAFTPGFYCDREMIADAVERRFMFNVVSHGTGAKADFVILREDAYSRAAFARRLRANAGGVEAWVSTAEDVVISKLQWSRESGSERQLADVRAILSAGRVDTGEYFSRWIRRLGLQRELDASRESRYDS